MTRSYSTKWFARFTRQEGIDNAALAEAIDRASRGLIDADLGGGLIKQRVARPGKGRSGGYRVLVAYMKARRAVFLYGFAKNERDNVAADELASLQEQAAAWLDATERQMAQAIEDKTLTEIEGASTQEPEPPHRGYPRERR